MPALRRLCLVICRWLVVTVLAVALPLTAAAPAGAAARRGSAHSAAGHQHAATHVKKKKRHKKHKKHRHHKKPKSTPTSKVVPKGVTPLPGTPAGGSVPTSTTPAATGAPSGPAPSPVTPALVTHLLAQQGLLVGMASNVLQNQLYLDVADGESVGFCASLDGGGSTQLTSSSHPSSTEVDETRVLYYATNCTQPYISSTATVTTTASGSQVNATSVYTSPAGTTLGSLRTEASTLDGTSDIKLAGLGSWVGAGGGAPVSLGLTCDAPTSSATVVPPFPCEGGVVQDFPSLGRALGSLTPLTMTIDTSGGGPALTFSSASPATMEIGTLGSLSLGLTPAAALAISGTPIATLADSVSGQAASFSLFPPTPTGWGALDLVDGQSFQIAVADNTSRALTGAVTAPGSAATSYASFSLDQSGTGTISYGGGPPVAVTSWILSG